MAYNPSFLSLRVMHETETPLYLAKLKIQDKKCTTFGGAPSFKDRLGVLCQTRLLLYKGDTIGH